MEQNKESEYNQGMKRITIALLLFSASLLFGAEMASWYIVTEPGYISDNGTEFSSASSEAATSSYPVGSVLELVSEESGRSTVVTVTDTLPELPEGRTIAVTEKAMNDLGLMDKGVGEVKERVLRLGKSTDNDGITGWYMYDLGLYTDSQKCYQDYKALENIGLKPAITTEGDAIHLYVEYVMAFARDNTEEAIRSLGLEISSMEVSPNPYS